MTGYLQFMWFHLILHKRLDSAARAGRVSSLFSGSALHEFLSFTLTFGNVPACTKVDRKRHEAMYPVTPVSEIDA